VQAADTVSLFFVLLSLPNRGRFRPFRACRSSRPSDPDGRWCKSLCLEALGAPHSIIGTASLDMCFPRQWFQAESGLHYNWHRQYDPTTGRYVQADPLRLVHIIICG
jgi:RHS repeat-associated protein